MSTRGRQQTSLCPAARFFLVVWALTRVRCPASAFQTPRSSPAFTPAASAAVRPLRVSEGRRGSGGDGDPPPPVVPRRLLVAAGAYVLAPALPAIILPLLADAFRASGDRDVLLAILASKRVFIYGLATAATAYAGWRAAESRLPAAGESLDALNREILRGESPEESRRNVGSSSGKSGPGGGDDSTPVFATLDENSGRNGVILALSLPPALGILLAGSYLMVGPAAITDEASKASLEIFFSAVSSFAGFSNFAVCAAFAAVEFRSAAEVSVAVADPSSERAEQSPPSRAAATKTALLNVAAVCAAAAAFRLPADMAWPLQNAINMALAVTVTRALAPFLYPDPADGKSIRTVALALVGLAAYDAVSVFGTAAAAASAGSSAVAPATVAAAVGTNVPLQPPPPSVMETVARSRMGGGGGGWGFFGGWQPGLLEIVLAGRVSDVLGLGDVVFPACAVAWAFSHGYAGAAVGGYVVGCITQEVVPASVAAAGLPALVFFAPSMLLAISLEAWRRGELKEIWVD